MVYFDKISFPSFPTVFIVNLTVSFSVPLQFSLSHLLSIYLSVYLYIYLSVYLFIDLNIYLCIYLSVYLFIDLNIYLCICISMYSLLPLSLPHLFAFSISHMHPIRCWQTILANNNFASPTIEIKAYHCSCDILHNLKLSYFTIMIKTKSVFFHFIFMKFDIMTLLISKLINS